MERSPFVLQNIIVYTYTLAHVANTPPYTEQPVQAIDFSLNYYLHHK